MFKLGKYFRKIIQLCIWFLWKLATIWPLVWLTRNKRLRFLTKRFSSKKNVGKFCNCHVVPNLKDLAKSYSEFDKWFANLVNEESEDEEEEEDDRESAKTDTESEEDLVVVNEQTPLQKSFKSTSQDNLNCHQVKLDYQLLLYRACIKGKVAILDMVVENFGIEKTKQLLEEPAPPPTKPKDSKIDSGLMSDSDTKPMTKDPFGDKMQDNQDDIYQSWPKLPAIHLAILFDHFSLITYLLAELKCPLTIDDQRFDLNSLMFGALINDRHTSVRSYDMILRAYLYGVDPNEQNREGYTALHFATKRNNCQAVKLLLRIGADTRLVNHRGETAADIAKQLGNKAIYRLLVDGLDSDQQQSKFKLGFLQHCLWSARLFRSFPHYRIYVLCILVGSVFTSFELLLCFGYLLPLYLTDYLIQLGDLFWTHCAMLLALFSVTATAFMTFYCDPGYCERKSSEYVETLDYLIENRLVYPFPPSSPAISTESLTNETKHNSEQQDSNNIVDNSGDICRESMFVSVDDKPKTISHSNRICCSPMFDQLIGARKRLMEIYEEDRHFCHICESVVSIYWSVSKHCYICDRCVARFDHHCVFLFNCIGSKNFASFVSFNLLFAYVGISGAAILGIGIQRKLAYPIDARIQPEPYEVSWDTFSSLDEFANFMLLVPYRDFFNLLIMVKFCVLCTILACSSLFRRYWLNR